MVGGVYQLRNVLTDEKRDPAVVEKMAASKRGKPLSIERRAAMSERLRGNSYRKGIPNSAEIRARVSAAQRGRKHSVETRLKMSAAANKRPRDAKGRLLSSQVGA